jgi:acyl-CoA thioester hydrolase
LPDRTEDTDSKVYSSVQKATSFIEVRYAETDQMGVVHHSHYPVYFEQGRTEYFQQHLKPYHEFEAEGLLAPVLSYTVDLKGRLTYGDTLELETHPSPLKGLRIVMNYRGYNLDKLVVEGSSTHALMGPGLIPLHPRKLPPCYHFLRESLHKLKNRPEST